MAVVHVEGLTTPWPHLGAFLPIWGCLYVWVLLFGSATALGVTFWVPTHAPKYLVTYFESVSAFLSYPAPGCPGRDLPLGSYLSRGRLWGDRGTSRVRLPYTDVFTMPWSHLFLLFITFPSYRDLRPSHGVAPSMVFPTHGYRGTTLWLPCFYTVWPGDALVGRRLHLGDALPWRRFCLAVWTGDALVGRRLPLTLTPSRWLWLWLSQRPDTGRYKFKCLFPSKIFYIYRVFFPFLCLLDKFK